MNDPGVIYFMVSRFPSRPLHDYYMNALRNEVRVRVDHDIYVGYDDWRAYTAREGINTTHIKDNNPNRGPVMNRIEYNYTRGYCGHPVNPYPRNIPPSPLWIYGTSVHKHFYWRDALYMSRDLNFANPSLRIFNWARYNPGNHIPSEQRCSPQTSCIVCKYTRSLWNHNCTRREDRLNKDFCRVVDDNGDVSIQSTRGHITKNPVHYCQQCRFPLCSRHFHPFHDVTNPEMNERGPNSDLDDEEDGERPG